MRFFSYFYDKNDLVRSFSVAVDGFEEVIEVEDYLQFIFRVLVEIFIIFVLLKVCLLISFFFFYLKSIFFNFFNYMIYIRVWVMLKVMIMYCNVVNIWYF